MNDDSLCNDFTYLLWSDKTGEVQVLKVLINFQQL